MLIDVDIDIDKHPLWDYEWDIEMILILYIDVD